MTETGAVPQRILVVDDDAALRRFLSDRLKSLGHHVETAQDGETALEVSRNNRFDLVLLDTPLALAVADAAAAARAADACLFLLRWNHTPRQAAAEALERLRQAGAAPCGVALSMVDLKREAGYRYGGYRGAAPDYSPYYA